LFDQQHQQPEKAMDMQQTTTVGHHHHAGTAAGAGRQQGRFPLLKSAEILECLSELEVEMKKQELMPIRLRIC